MNFQIYLESLIFISIFFIYLFQDRFNEILETTRTNDFQFSDEQINLAPENISEASDWPTDQKRAYKNYDIFTSKRIHSLSF
jgi:hypothetical protein